jgi:hypothetical protein
VQKLHRFLPVVVIFAAVWAYSSRHGADGPTGSPAPSASQPHSLEAADTPEQDEPSFQCDGRTYCSQMTSCAEAKYFLEHCPNVKMDGDRDGIPCEKQWCPTG